MTRFSQPTLPPLYFANQETSRLRDDKSNRACVPELPAEILSKCLSDYADWGDLARLACVQKSWSNTLMDAANHMIESKWELAQALLEGKCGLQKNPKRAMKLLKELARVTMDEQGKPTGVIEGEEESFAPAMKQIAECYFEGAGIAQNSTIGLAWLKAAHELANDADAAHDTALTYEYALHGIEIDVVAASQWFEKAAVGGHTEAMAELGLCYELGCGVEQCDEIALDWYTKAAEKGHVTAKFSVAEAFEEARGVPQSDEEACLWYYRAAIVGDEDSKMALRRLYDIARIVLPGVGELLNE
jgi:TPR repeat protein